MGMLIGSIGICLKTVHMIIVSGIFHLIAGKKLIGVRLEPKVCYFFISFTLARLLDYRLKGLLL